MPSDSLDNYIRMHRRRFALSQEEVAYLLGVGSAGTVARYESSRRTPTLETALALEAVFGVSVAELYAGKFNQVEQSVQERACELVEKLREAGASPATTAKLRHLTDLCQGRPAA
jgi:transcriptional regulator with XRE-family HTH domain